jgi:hypothetical protein
VGQAGYPTDPIEAWTRPVAMPGSVVVAATSSTDPSALLFVEGTAASVAVRAAEPRPLPLFASEGPFLLQLDDLSLTVNGDSNLGPAKTTNAQHRVVFQELVV